MKNRFVKCGACAYDGTVKCKVRQIYKGVVLDPESGCTYGKPKQEAEE